MKLLTESQKTALWYGVPALVSRSFGFILLPLYTRLLSPREYGLVGVTAVISNLLRLSVLPGVEAIYLRYGYGGFKGKDAARTDLFSPIVAIHLFLVFVWLPAWYFPVLFISHRFAPDVPNRFILIAVAALALGSLQSPWSAGLRVRQKVRQIAWIQTLGTLVSGGVAISGLFFLNLGALSLLLGDLVSSLVLLPLCVPSLLSGLSRLKEKWDRSAFFEILKAFWVVGPDAIAYWIFTALDRFVLNFFKGPAETGLYTAGYQFGSLILSIASIGAKHWQVIVYQSDFKDDSQVRKLGALYRVSTSFFLSVSALMAVSAVAVANLFLGPRFSQSQKYIPIVSLLIALRIPPYFFNYYCWANGLRRDLLKSHLVAVLGFAMGCFILIPPFGGVGAAWAGVIGVLGYWVFIHTKKTKELEWMSLKLEFTDGICLVAVFLSFFGVMNQTIEIATGLALSLIILKKGIQYFKVIGSFSG